MNNWTKQSSKIVYQNPWITVHEDQVVRPDGSQGIYSFVETPPSVYIVPIDEHGNIYLIGLYRYTLKRFSWEVAGGRSDRDNVQTAARRELAEELGLTAGSLTEVGSFQPMNGISSETSHVFIAHDISVLSHNEQKEEGISQVKKVKFEEVFPLIQHGEITDGQSICALLQAAFVLGYRVSH